MAACQPVRSGFTAAFQRPALFAAETAWRWAFTAASWLLIAYGVLLFLHSVPVSDADMFGLSGIIPGRVASTILHILAGSGPRMARLALALLLGISFLSWMATSLGRAAILRSLIPDPEGRLATLFRLTLLRTVGATLVVLAYAGCAFLVFRVGNARQSLPASGAGDPALLFAGLACVLAWLWARIDSRLTLAGMLGLRRELTAFGAVVEAAEVSLRRVKQFAWVGIVFGLMRILLVAAAAVAAMMVFGMFAAVSPALGLLAVLGVALLYSLLANFLSVSALAARLRVIEWDASSGHQ